MPELKIAETSVLRTIINYSACRFSPKIGRTTNVSPHFLLYFIITYIIEKAGPWFITCCIFKG